MRQFVVPLVAVALAACATVRHEDLASWRGQPVAKLDTHPIFLTLPVEIKKLGDGVEVRNYVNGKNVGICFDNSVESNFSPATVVATGSSFCSQRFAACNNIFYIQDGRVVQYTPVGTGGIRCYTDERLTPDGWRGHALNMW